MKTSNKILCTAGTAFLLLTTGTYAFLYTKYQRTKAYPQELLQQLTDTRIRTITSQNTQYDVIADNVYTNGNPNILTQYLDLAFLPTPETAFIRGDTLQLHFWVPELSHIQLPYIDDDYLQGKK